MVPIAPCKWLAELRDVYGRKLLLLVFVVNHLVKGVLVSLQQAASAWLFKAYAVPASQVQIYHSIVGLAWAAKPVMGLISDVFPIGGLKKAPYVLLFCLLGLVSTLGIGLLPQSSLPITMLVAGLFLIEMLVSTSDLLTEARYAGKLRDQPSYAPSLVSFVWGGICLAWVVGNGVAGPMIVYFGPKVCFSLGAIPMALLVALVLLGYYEEERLNSEAVAAVRRKLFEQWEMCFLCLLVAICSIALISVGMAFHSPFVNSAVAATVAGLMLVSYSVLLHPTLGRYCAFSLLQASTKLSLRGAAFYFYTDTEKEYPDGPNFDPYFYNTVMGICSNAVSFVAIIVYYRYLSSWTYRGILTFSNIFYAVFCLPDCILFSRLNLRMGISDKVFVMGATSLQEVMESWMWMPGVVIVSQLCPKGREATMYALVAACLNMGLVLQKEFGAVLLYLLGCRPNGTANDATQFDNMWMVSLVSTLLPLGVIATIPYLVPEGRQTESLVAEDAKIDASMGSLLRRWQNPRRSQRTVLAWDRQACEAEVELPALPREQVAMLV